MSDATTRLQLPWLAPGQAQKHVTLNESLQRLDAIVQLSVVSATTTVEPSSPADGDIWIIPSGKSGAHWASYANGALACFRDGVWEQIGPREGWLAFVNDTDRILAYTGSAWVDLSAALRVSATDRLLGRASSGAGGAEEIVCTAAGRALLDDASAAAQRATLDAAGLSVSNAFSSAQSITAGGAALSIGPGGTGTTPGLYLRLELGSGGGYGGFQIRTNGTQKFLWYYDINQDEGRWATSALDPAIRLAAAGHFIPGSDNGQSLGNGSRRWSAVYAGTGTINTSDAREKTSLRALTPAELRAIRRVVAGLGIYRWREAVERKGEDARLHVGVTAQDVAVAFEAEGLDAACYGLFCADVEEDGEGRTRFGVRYDELFAMALAAAFSPA